MKVICINHDDFDSAGFPWTESDPKIGSEYEVIRIAIGEDANGKHFDSYKLKGFPLWVYDQRNFSPLTGLDETALVTEEFEEKYCVPVNSMPCV